MKPTPKEKIQRRRKKLKYGAIKLIVVAFHIAGIILADPWQTYRAGGVPEFIPPANALEIVFSIFIGVGLLYGVQEYGGDTAPKNRRGRVVKRCMTAFIMGAGVGAA